jgi:hypothetical protein
MTVTAASARNVSTAAVGAVIFPYSFKLISAADLLVTVNGVTKLLGTHYTVSGVGLDIGGNVTFVTPLVGGEVVLRQRVMPLARSTDYQVLGDLRAATINNDIDATVLMIQQVNDAVGQAIRLPANSSASAQLPTLVAGSSLVVNPTATGFDMGSGTLTGDLALRGALANGTAPGYGGDLVNYYDPVSATYLKTVSDIINGSEVSLHRFIPSTQHAGIRNFAGTYDATADIQAAVTSGAKSILIPRGQHQYSGNITPTAGVSLDLHGVGPQHSVLRCFGAGGIVYNGGAVTQQFHMPVLNLSRMKIEASVVNAGTAVTMAYTGGLGTPPIGPLWTDVLICPSNETIGPGGVGFNRGVRGTNVRDMHCHRVTIAGNSSTAAHPLGYTMTEGFYMDGDAAIPVELWMSECYLYYLQTGFQISGQYEGVYIDKATSLAIWSFLKWQGSSPHPVAQVTNSYIGSERLGILLDNVVGFNIHGNSFSSTAPVPNASYEAVQINRTAGNPTLSAQIRGNEFAAGGYFTTSGGLYTERGVHVISANTLDITDNKFTAMDIGVLVDASATNVQIRSRNVYTNCAVNESIPAATRSADGVEILMRVEPTGASLAIAVNTPTKVIFGFKAEDTGGAYFDTTLSRYTPPSGRYDVSAQLKFTTGMVAGEVASISLYKNGAEVKANGIACNYAGSCHVTLACKVIAGGADYFEIFATVSTAAGGTRTVLYVPSVTFWDMQSRG